MIFNPKSILVLGLFLGIVISQEIITTVAGNGTSGFNGDNQQATAASLSEPHFVVGHPQGGFLLSEFAGFRIRRVDANGVITTFAGNGNIGFTGDFGPATAATINGPEGLTFDVDGNLFFTDSFNHRIRRVDTAGTILTIVGTGTGGFDGDGQAGILTDLNFPRGIFASEGALGFCDSVNNRVRVFIGTVQTLTGSANGGFSGDGGPSINAEINLPSDLVLDAAGNLYFTDVNNNRVRKIDGDGTITTVAGDGNPVFAGDGGPAVNASLRDPYGLAFANGFLFISDAGNHRVRKVDLATGIITTVAGNGTQDFCGDDGLAINACLDDPRGLSFDTQGDLLIADTGNNRIRKVAGLFPPPPATTAAPLPPGATTADNGQLVNDAKSKSPFLFLLVALFVFMLIF